jgi:predicted CoA-substrate-specific enzyme activase
LAEGVHLGDLFFAGIDIGSTMTKAVIINAEGNIAAAIKGPTGAEHRHLANDVMLKALDGAGLKLEDVACIIATGYGRFNVPFADEHITELSCHAKGVCHLFPGARTVVDIGGQDAKCLKVREGRLIDFAMNDKCAAGTGRFLELTAQSLGIKVEDLAALSEKATSPVEISNMCTIFAQQEVVMHLSQGKRIEDIIAGLHRALAERVAALARRLGVEPEVVLTGGVAKNAGMVLAMGQSLDCELLVPEEPLLTGALGAALLARERTIRLLAEGKPLERKPRRLEKATFYS